ncbi:hypothetical protein BDD43_2846 [Mucilaginibacter gracilis]|uniref:Uncharacterized protein n=1 Tax=Mucilaginibacter gracilis TaxID=423350 RepID=A0A495J1Z4_9SPHI|nr:hypothetical protein [Mucilaginibacter gracilis]RKR82661.1 hypothetical protein BDD43_2846 [Mucilaginibacter gracilis]
MSKVLFLSEQQLKDNSVIEAHVDSKILSNTIWEVQEFELKPILGKDLYQSIANEVLSASTISGYTISETNLELLTDYIKPFLIYGTLSYGFIPLHYKITNKGINRLTDSSVASLQSTELEYVKNNYDTKFDNYKLRLVNHLAVDLKEDVSDIIDTTGDSTGWFIPDNQINVEDFFESLASKTGLYRGYIRRGY